MILIRENFFHMYEFRGINKHQDRLFFDHSQSLGMQMMYSWGMCSSIAIITPFMVCHKSHRDSSKRLEDKFDIIMRLIFFWKNVFRVCLLWSRGRYEKFRSSNKKINCGFREWIKKGNTKESIKTGSWGIFWNKCGDRNKMEFC